MAVAGAQRGGRSPGGDVPDGIPGARKSKIKDRPLSTLGLMRSPNVEDGKISISSPIARALIGKEVGDSVEVNTPGGGKSYEILGVKFI